MAAAFLRALRNVTTALRNSFQLFDIGFGYASGGTVTQITDKTTAFTLDALSGRIIFAASALAAFTSSSATWTNSHIGSADSWAWTQNSGQNKYGFNIVCSNGQAQIVMYNASNGTLTEAVAINFVLFKGSNS